MMGLEIPDLVTLPVTKSSQYLYTWSGGSLLLSKCKCQYTKFTKSTTVPAAESFLCHQTLAIYIWAF